MKEEQDSLRAQLRERPGDIDVMNRLMEASLPMVRRALRSVAIRLPSHVQLEDLLQAGVIALFRSIERYNPDNGNSLESYAYPRIRGAILDELRGRDHVSRRDRALLNEAEAAVGKLTGRNGAPPSEEDIAAEMGIGADRLRALMERARPWLSLDQPVAEDDGGGKVLLRDVLADASIVPPDAKAAKEDDLRQFRRAFRTLSQREQKILYLYYYEDLRLSEIATILGVTEARICQINSLAIARLRAIIRQLER